MLQWLVTHLLKLLCVTLQVVRVYPGQMLTLYNYLILFICIISPNYSQNEIICDENLAFSSKPPRFFQAAKNEYQQFHCIGNVSYTEIGWKLPDHSADTVLKPNSSAGDGRIIVTSNNTLIFQRTQLNDTGDYVCVVLSRENGTNCTAMLSLIVFDIPEMDYLRQFYLCLVAIGIYVTILTLGYLFFSK